MNFMESIQLNLINNFNTSDHEKTLKQCFPLSSVFILVEKHQNSCEK
jgi:hypothetical protein